MGNNQPAGHQTCSRFETMDPPIRTLPCGHNISESLLIQRLKTSTILSCPKCDQVFPNHQDIQSLIRNEDLENAYKEIRRLQGEPTPVPVLSGNVVDSLKRRYNMHMANGNYEDALQTLRTIIVNVKNVEKVLCLFDKAQCEVKMLRFDDALNSASEIISLIEANSSMDEFKKSVEKVESRLKSLIQNLTHIRQTEFLVMLLSCWINFIKMFFSQKVLLSKIEEVFSQIANLTEELINQNREIEIKEYFPLMDEMHQILQTRKDVDVEFKYNAVANILQIYGSICNHASEWPKSVEVHNKAISVKETASGDEAMNYQILGHCYNNIGRAYSNLKQTENARSCFEKAVRIYRYASDYESEAARRSDLKNAEQNLMLADKYEMILSPQG